MPATTLQSTPDPDDLSTITLWNDEKSNKTPRLRQLSNSEVNILREALEQQCHRLARKLAVANGTGEYYRRTLSEINTAIGLIDLLPPRAC